MYKSFDEFLRVPTWYKKEGGDQERFFIALAEVVERQDFYPDSLGEYMDRKRADGQESLAKLSQEAYDSARHHYVHMAHAVQRYLRWQRR
jgi:hypothetical protein